MRYVKAYHSLRWVGVVMSLVVCLGAFMALGTLSSSAEDILEITVPSATDRISIDGIATDGEYQAEYTMDATNGEAWVGTLGRETSSTWRFAWDDKGFYVCVTAKDNTPVYRGENTHWVGADCVEIGLNPGYVLTQKDDKGVFFSMGATADGRVVIHRHNYDERMVTSEVQGVSTGHIQGSDSYTIEVCIPWSIILIEADCTKTDTHLNATHLIPKADLEMDIVLAHIDASDDQNISVAYKLADTDFVTGRYVTGTLVGDKHEDTQTDTVAETHLDTVTLGETVVLLEPSTEVQESATKAVSFVDSEEQTNQQVATSGGCASLLSGSCLVMLAGISLLCIKRRKRMA